MPCIALFINLTIFLYYVHTIIINKRQCDIIYDFLVNFCYYDISLLKIRSAIPDRVFECTIILYSV